MSAFILSDKHFSALACFVSDETGISPQTIADKLKRINIESVNFRYNEKTRFSKVKLTAQRDYSKSDIICLIKCWSYQSCENGRSLDFLMMDAYLLSFFSKADLDAADYLSELWNI